MCQFFWPLMPFMHNGFFFLQGTHGRLLTLSLKEVIHLIENRLKCEHNLHIFQVFNCKCFHARIVDHTLLDKFFLKLCKCVYVSWYIICSFKLSADLSTFYFHYNTFLSNCCYYLSFMNLYSIWVNPLPPSNTKNKGN